MNTAVALIFFNRPSTLRQVFDKIKQAKPPKLFLIQDGPRNEQDIVKIQECRTVVSNIDWDCEVVTDYAEENLGCGVRPQSGITNALKQVDKLIILEDDCVPELSFFQYCEELLEKYENDERIAYISGLNHFEEWDFGGDSYGFTKTGAIWGWATWRRAWARYDYAVSEINNEYTQKLLKLNVIDSGKRINVWKETNQLVMKNQKISYWDWQWGFVKYAQSQYVIVPKYNLICNIGTGVDATHAQKADAKYKKYNNFNNMPTKAIEFPLTHPKHMLCAKDYDTMLTKCNKRRQRKAFFAAILGKLKGDR